MTYAADNWLNGNVIDDDSKSDEDEWIT
jgi:hypothetical protein